MLQRGRCPEAIPTPVAPTRSLFFASFLSRSWPSQSFEKDVTSKPSPLQLPSLDLSFFHLFSFVLGLNRGLTRFNHCLVLIWVFDFRAFNFEVCGWLLRWLWFDLADKVWLWFGSPLVIFLSRYFILGYSGDLNFQLWCNLYRKSVHNIIANLLSYKFRKHPTFVVLVGPYIGICRPTP